MKLFNVSELAMVLLIALTLLLTSCQKDGDELNTNQNGLPKMEWRSNPNNALYPPNAHPFGKSYEEWAQEFWIRLMSFDCATIFSEDVYPLNQDQPVFFLSGSVGTYSVDVTIPREKAILTPIINYINDYPCPDPDFQPEPGQTLEEFLQEGAAWFIDLVDNIEVTLDGEVLEDMETYRFSTDLFYFTGNPDLTTCLDPCVTGESQAAVTDGYYLIFKKMAPGQHTLHLAAEIPDFGLVLDGTFNITVE